MEGIVNVSVKRSDGFQNVMSGLGTTGLDRTANTFYRSNNWRQGLERYWSNRFSLYDYGDLYLNNGIVQKIIDRPADDAFQRGVEIDGDEEGSIEDEYDRLFVLPKMADAVRWARLYGGAAILLIVKDGGTLEDELNYDAIDAVEELQVYALPSIKAGEVNYTADDTDDVKKIGQPIFYDIAAPGVSSFRVHETRLLLVPGEPMPERYAHIQGMRWIGRSAITGCIEDISRYDQALQWTIRLLERKQQGIYSMEGLGELFAQEADDIVTKRINLVDLVRGNLNSIVIDKNDTYTIENLGLDGIQSVLQECQVSISASANMPVVILFGKSTTGLNNTGSGDLESYYGMVSHIQQVIAKPVLEKLTAIIYVQRTYPGKLPDTWHIEFEPLWQPTEQEKATADNQQQQANNTEVTMLITLMSNGIISPEEIRKIVVNKYSEYDFPDEIPADAVSSMDYAAGVDTTQLDVPQDPNQPTVNP
jgi:phage-related protein (TIGR01555 family)